MTPYDPIPELVRLGYTPRESAFLYLVGRVSGYFLGRQYSTFLQRKRGALIYQLIDKGRNWQHFGVSDYGQHRYVYHLKSKLIYELLECPDSQNRRAKGDDEIKTRLMVLDYVLHHLDQQFLSLESEKIPYFPHYEGISSLSITQRFPLFVTENNGESLLTFTYFDNDTTTVRPFSRYLNSLAPLVAKMDKFELLYVALSARNLAPAQAAFEGQFPEIKLAKSHLLLPYGADHLVGYFEAQHLWDEDSPHFKQKHLAVLREGEQLYTRPEHEHLRAAWRQGPDKLRQEIREIYGIRQMSGRFRTAVLQGPFPLFRCRQRGRPTPTTVLEVAV